MLLLDLQYNNEHTNWRFSSPDLFSLMDIFIRNFLNVNLFNIGEKRLSADPAKQLARH